MPKNKGLGGKKRRKGRVIGFGKRELVLKEAGQEYAQVVKSLGGGFMELLCFTNNGCITKRGHIRGKMRKRDWLSKDDIVLVNIREYQDSTCDILLKYTSDEARLLRSRNIIPDSSGISQETHENSSKNEDNIVFVDVVDTSDNIINNNLSDDLDWCTGNLTSNKLLESDSDSNNSDSNDSDSENYDMMQYL